jgi:hypothetical protein
MLTRLPSASGTDLVAVESHSKVGQVFLSVPTVAEKGQAGMPVLQLTARVWGRFLSTGKTGKKSIAKTDRRG